MENIYLGIGLILGYVVICILYAGIILRKKNDYLRYGVLILIMIHSGAQLCLIGSKWKHLLLQTEIITFLQVGILIIGIILLVINGFADKYIIKQDKKQKETYCVSYLDNIRIIAKEKEASKEIQDLLKYMTPKKCDCEDEKIENLLKNLTKDNTEESYHELKRIIAIREEKLKAQCNR